MDIKARVKDLITQDQFKLIQSSKNKLLLPILKAQILNNMEFSPNIILFLRFHQFLYPCLKILS